MSVFIFYGKLFHIAFHISRNLFLFLNLACNAVQNAVIPDLSFVLPGLYVINGLFSLDNCMFFCNLFRGQHNDLSLMSSVNFKFKIYVKKCKIYVNFHLRPPVFINLSHTVKYGCFCISLSDSESGANVHTLTYILSSVCAG